MFLLLLHLIVVSKIPLPCFCFDVDQKSSVFFSLPSLTPISDVWKIFQKCTILFCRYLANKKCYGRLAGFKTSIFAYKNAYTSLIFLRISGNLLYTWDHKFFSLYLKLNLPHALTDEHHCSDPIVDPWQILNFQPIWGDL